MKRERKTLVGQVQTLEFEVITHKEKEETLAQSLEREARREQEFAAQLAEAQARLNVILNEAAAKDKEASMMLEAKEKTAREQVQATAALLKV